MLFLLDALFYSDCFRPSYNLPEFLFRLSFQKVFVLLVDRLFVVEPISILAILDPDYRVAIFILVRRGGHPGILNPWLSEAYLVFHPLNEVRAFQRCV